MLFDRLKKLETVSLDLAELVVTLSKEMDIVVVCGYRGEKEQMEAFRQKKSKLRWPRSDHNTKPSKAVDLAPCNSQGIIDWNDRNAFLRMQDRLRELAKEKGVELKPIIKWDLPHISLK